MSVLVLCVIAVIALAYGLSGAQRPAAGVYAGTTAQGLPIVLTVAADRHSLALNVRWTCAQDTVRTIRGQAVRIGADGAFAWRGRTPRRCRAGMATKTVSACDSPDAARTPPR